MEVIIMKHYIGEITYTAAPEMIAATVGEHRAFLQTGYDRGWLLLSGPQVPKTGGMIVCRAPSLEELHAFFANDPYQIKALAEYRFTEFEPVKFQPFLMDWVG
jgi:uncharacterized protein YciI